MTPAERNDLQLKIAVLLWSRLTNPEPIPDATGSYDGVLEPWLMSTWMFPAANAVRDAERLHEASVRMSRRPEAADACFEVSRR